MHLKRVSLTNFRNFIRLETDFPAGSTILVGANGQGKTSLLEAIYYLTGAASFHTASDRHLINFLALEESMPFARLVAEVESQERIQRIEIRILIESNSHSREGRVRKEVLVNGVKRRMRELASSFNAVLFLPQDMKIIEGAPGDRRHFLNSSIAQADSTYAAALSEYQKVLTQRNALLKKSQEGRGLLGQLTFWDEQLCDLAASLIRGRALALRELDQLAAPIHLELTRKKETLQLDYQPSYDPAPQPDGQLGLPIDAVLDHTGISREEIRKGMLETLERNRGDELARGLTIQGPHRDDFRPRSNGIDLRLYGSRGQNRTAMLAMKLAEIEWLKQRTGEWPILLLDEVLAELDIDHREDILSHISSATQSILTAADLSMFTKPFQQHATIWQIDAGTIAPRSG
ncbi:MAG: DNA replication/repair protein RecF [Anaerolineales bacterium]